MHSLTVALYPTIEPYDRGMLAVGDGNAIAWDVAGSPHGKPAVVLHGGPGQGCSPKMLRAFNPDKYRIILFDQRGCGRSTPHASDPATPMRFNTTEHLIADMEALREHLGVDRWLVSGGSWGAALAVAYAERHPARVSEMVLSTVVTARRCEAEWLYRDLAWFFPEAAERFRAHVAESADGDVIAAYARRMEDPDQSVRLLAARAWCAWEDAVLSLEPVPATGRLATLSPEDALAFARICIHYAHHGAWLEEGALIRDAGRLSGIPAVLIHGRRDLTCPVDTAYRLARTWQGARLIVLDDAGHLASDSKRRALLEALDVFARG